MTTIVRDLLGGFFPVRMDRVHAKAREIRKEITKVYVVRHHEWWAGESREQVIDAVAKAYRLDADTLQIRQLSQDELKGFQYLDRHGCISFRERLNNLIDQGAKFPCVFPMGPED
jgi:hypothetical protein